MTRAESGAGGTHDASCPAGPTCCVCGEPIGPDQYGQAVCWTDPGGEYPAAHTQCLVRLGEAELGLSLCPECGGSGWRPVPDPAIPGTTIDSRCSCGARW